MSFHVTFNLDELSSTRFQELCNVLLQNYFSELITPMVRSGRDGQLDGMSDKEPINYSDLLRAPCSYLAPDGSRSFWAFQCKHTQREGDTNRNNAVLAAVRSEVATWSKKQTRPTHYIFMTNVNLTASCLSDVMAIGNVAFGYFDIWHEPKIACFIANSVALQKTFFPTRSTSLDLVLAHAEPQVTTTNTRVAPAEGGNTESPPTTAIQRLAEYEIAFLDRNVSFLKVLQATNEPQELPESWKTFILTSRCDGLLTLASDPAPLQWLADNILQKNVFVKLWLRFLGEETKVGEEVARVAYSPDVEADLIANLNALVTCGAGTNEANVAVDRYLRDQESRILTHIKSNSIQDAQDGLLSLLKARADYSQFKSGRPEASYPNMRRLGPLPVFGWDFVALWDRVLKNICDVVFSGTYPRTVSDLIVSFPFHLCIEAIRDKRPKESFQSELQTLKVVFWVIAEKGDPALMSRFLDKLDDLAQAVSDLDDDIDSLPDAEWGTAISKEVATYVAELGYLALAEKAPLPIDVLDKALSRVTSLGFERVLPRHGTVGAGSNVLEIRDALTRSVAASGRECLFAWATFAWHQERVVSDRYDPTFARSLLARIGMRDIVTLYNKNSRPEDHGWIESWFRPEGKRVSWSWTSDHDVRDILQLALLSLPVEPADVADLDLFQVSSSYEPFVRQLQELHDRLVKRGVTVSPLETVTEVLKSAVRFQEQKLDDLVRRHVVLSAKKLEEIDTDFRDAMKKGTREGSLYLVEETLDARGLQASHVVGRYMIQDKIWYLDDTGRTYYSVSGNGSSWAEEILLGRLHVLTETARQIAIQVLYDPTNLRAVLENIRDTEGSDQVLLAYPSTIPWQLAVDLRTNEAESRPIYQGIGAVDFVQVRFLKKGELLLIPKRAFSWVVRQRAVHPTISIVDLLSEEAKKIEARNPGIDLSLKVLVSAREQGTMTRKDGSAAPKLYAPAPMAPIVPTGEQDPS